jgi:hypothetical protein
MITCHGSPFRHRSSAQYVSTAACAVPGIPGRMDEDRMPIVYMDKPLFPPRTL